MPVVRPGWPINGISSYQAVIDESQDSQQSHSFSGGLVPGPPEVGPGPVSLFHDE